MFPDHSTEYASYPTLAPLPDGTPSPNAYLSCPVCGGTAFRLRRMDQTPVCTDCKAALELEAAAEAAATTERIIAYYEEEIASLQYELAKYRHIPEDVPSQQRAEPDSKAKHRPVSREAASSPVKFQIARGPDHTVVLRPDGTVKAVGNNPNGQCNVQDWTGVTSVATNRYYTVGLCENGTVRSTLSGFLNRGILKEFNAWKNVTAVEMGLNFTVACCADGTVRSVGIRLPVMSGITAIAAGGSQVAALCEDGSVRAFGTPVNACKVQDWSGIKAIAAGYQHTVGLCEDGTVKAVGYNRKSRVERIPRCEVSGWSRIKAIAAGRFHTVGLDEDGRVHAVGMNSNGQCNVSDWSDVVAVCADENFTAGLRADGTVLCTDPTVRKLLEEIYSST